MHRRADPSANEQVQSSAHYPALRQQLSNPSVPVNHRATHARGGAPRTTASARPAWRRSPNRNAVSSSPQRYFTLEQEAGGKFEKDMTSVPFVGTKSVMVTLKKGKRKFYCKVHEPTMFGFFTVK